MSQCRRVISLFHKLALHDSALHTSSLSFLWSAVRCQLGQSCRFPSPTCGIAVFMKEACYVRCACCSQKRVLRQSARDASIETKETTQTGPNVWRYITPTVPIPSVQPVFIHQLSVMVASLRVACHSPARTVQLHGDYSTRQDQLNRQNRQDDLSIVRSVYL